MAVGPRLWEDASEAAGWRPEVQRLCLPHRVRQVVARVEHKLGLTFEELRDRALRLTRTKTSLALARLGLAAASQDVQLENHWALSADGGEEKVSRFLANPAGWGWVRTPVCSFMQGPAR